MTKPQLAGCRLKTLIVKTSDKDSVEIAAEYLRRGKIIAYPTETSYGLGVDITNAAAVKKLYMVKQRMHDTRLPFVFGSLAIAKNYVKLNKIAIRLCRSFMPGPLTLISDIRPTNLVRKKLVYTERAWRISSHPWTKRLALSFKKPISSTSANISSNPPIYDIKDLIRQFDGKINLIVDDGNLLPCKPSTIFDTRMCSILRPGPITKKAIENVIHKKVREGKLRVLAGGCFNAIHKGHIYFLREAKKLGDELIVVIANDAHNNKPYAVKATIRKKSLDSLGIANKAVIGEKDGFIGTVLKERPDVIALGYNQELPPDVIEKFSNLKVVRIKKFGHYSTSKMARRNLISAKD